MKQPLWTPSEDKIKNANMTRFIEFVNKEGGRDNVVSFIALPRVKAR